MVYEGCLRRSKDLHRPHAVGVVLYGCCSLLLHEALDL